MTVHLTHWGTFEAVSDGERLTGVRPWRGDPEPTPLIGNVAAAQHHPARISQPHVRKGWLDRGPGAAGRGDEPFVPVSWGTALDLLSAELRRVYRDRGAEAVYGGSYGWASAGRFHHAQSQLHRFLNCLGGYVRHVNSYSLGTSTVLLPYVIADVTVLQTHATAKSVIAEHTGLVVAFGGLSPKNAAVSPGGVSRHHTRGWMSAARARGCRFVSVSPLRDDTPAEAQAEWIAPRPGTDAALMLALAQVLDADGLADTGFLDRYTVGFALRSGTCTPQPGCGADRPVAPDQRGGSRATAAASDHHVARSTFLDVREPAPTLSSGAGVNIFGAERTDRRPQRGRTHVAIGGL